MSRTLQSAAIHQTVEFPSSAKQNHRLHSPRWPCCMGSACLSRFPTARRQEEHAYSTTSLSSRRRMTRKTSCVSSGHLGHNPVLANCKVDKYCLPPTNRCQAALEACTSLRSHEVGKVSRFLPGMQAPDINTFGICVHNAGSLHRIETGMERFTLEVYTSWMVSHYHCARYANQYDIRPNKIRFDSAERAYEESASPMFFQKHLISRW
jgi:hypothetical protein